MKSVNYSARWIIAAASLGAVSTLLSTAQIRAEEVAAEEEPSPVHISREANGLVVLTLDAETQQRIAMKFVSVEAASVQPTVVAHGRLVADPARSFTLRAPAAGVLQAWPEQEWPRIGAVVQTDAMLGFIAPRFTASETVDLQARRWDAHAEFDEISADLEAVRASFENKSRLNTGGGLVSDRALEEARAQYKSGEARLAAATQKVELYESLVTGRMGEDALFPIRASVLGEVVEVQAQPGEEVDMGQILLRTASFDTLIAEVSLFVGDVIESPGVEAQIAVAGTDGPLLTGTPIGPGSEASLLTGGQTMLFEVAVPAKHHLRPGLAVTAHVPTQGTPLIGVQIPRSSVLRHGGRTWVYVKTGEDRFERRDTLLYQPTSKGWFATSGVAPGEKIVVDGAQLLLSEERKAQIESEEEAEE